MCERKVLAYGHQTRSEGLQLAELVLGVPEERPMNLTKLSQIKRGEARLLQKGTEGTKVKTHAHLRGWFANGRLLIACERWLQAKAVEGYRTPRRWRVGEGSIPIGLRGKFEISGLRKCQ